MRVLILCDMFPPAFGPRMGYLCKYLKKRGWTPTVVTEYIPEKAFAFLEEEVEVIAVDFYAGVKRRESLRQRIALFLRQQLFDDKNSRLYQVARQRMDVEPFDLILCSTYRTFPLGAARRLAKEYQLPLITDLRDVVEQYSGNEFIASPLPTWGGVGSLIAWLFKKQNVRQRNRVLRRADHVTTVSPWHCELLKKINPEVSLIYNGYDPELFFPAPRPNDRFYLTYTGRVQSLELRDPTLLFEALRALHQRGVIDATRFRVRWFTDKASEQLIRREAATYELLDYMDFLGFLPAHQIPDVLNESAMLLLLTNKADASGPQGIMTTKFFEALAVEKPILAVRGDEGCLEEVIQQTQAGLSAHHVEEVIDFLSAAYQQWLCEGVVSSSSLRGEITRFSREAQADQFIELFNHVIEAYG